MEKKRNVSMRLKNVGVNENVGVGENVWVGEVKEEPFEKFGGWGEGVRPSGLQK